MIIRDIYVYFIRMTLVYFLTAAARYIVLKKKKKIIRLDYHSYAHILYSIILYYICIYNIIRSPSDSFSHRVKILYGDTIFLNECTATKTATDAHKSGKDDARVCGPRNLSASSYTINIPSPQRDI